MSVESWSAYDEGYRRAYQWAAALAQGSPLPQEATSTQLGPDEVAHAHFAPVGIAGFLGEDTQYRPSFFLFGGPAGLALSGAASLAHNASKKAEARQAAIPRWHQLGTADIVVTNQRLAVTGNGQTASLWYAETGPLQMATGPGGARRPVPASWPPGAPGRLALGTGAVRVCALPDRRAGSWCVGAGAPARTRERAGTAPVEARGGQGGGAARVPAQPLDRRRNVDLPADLPGPAGGRRRSSPARRRAVHSCCRDAHRDWLLAVITASVTASLIESSRRRFVESEADLPRRVEEVRERLGRIEAALERRTTSE